jgi:hypothetical protein
MLHQYRVGGGLFDNCPIGRQIALEKRDATCGINRIAETAYYVLLEAHHIIQLFPQRTAGDGQGIKVQLRA